MNQIKSTNGISEFMVRDTSIGGYTRKTPRQITFDAFVRKMRESFSLWSTLLIIGTLLPVAHFV